MDGGRHSTKKFPEVMTTPECNKADIDWYGRKPTDPPLVDTKAGKLLGLCKEEDATLAPTFPIRQLASTSRWVGM